VCACVLTSLVASVCCQRRSFGYYKKKNINGNEKKNEDRRYRKVRKIKKKLCFSLSFFALSSSTHLSCLAPFLLSSHFILFLYRSLSLNYFFAFLPVFVFISFSPYGRSNSIKKKNVDSMKNALSLSIFLQFIDSICKHKNNVLIWLK